MTYAQYVVRDEEADPGEGRPQPSTEDQLVTLRLLLVSPARSYRIGDHLTVAHDLGCDVVIVTNAAVAIPGSAIVTDLADPQRAATAVLAACARPIDGVVGTDGAAVAVAGAIARRVGLPANGAVALRAADDKLAQRHALARAGVSQPAFAIIAPRSTGSTEKGPATEMPNRGLRRDIVDLLPAVVKPIDRTASQGVLAAETPAEFRAAVARVRRLVGANAPVLVERFVPGIEVAVDALLRDGRMQVLAVFDKPDTPTGPTFPETLLISPARLPPDIEATVCEVVVRAARAIGLTEGPIHAECKVDGDDVWFLELAARSIGGLCSRSLQVAGLRVEELVIRAALGLDIPSARTTAATGVLMLPVPAAGRLIAVHGVDRAREVEGVTGIVISVGRGEALTPLPDGDRYLGFVFANAATPDDCEHALRAAWSELDVEIDSSFTR